MIRLAVVAIASAVPIVITVCNLYDDHRLADVVAHFSSGVAIGAVVGLVVGPAGVLAVATGLALGWEYVEPRLQRYVGDMTVGYEDTVGDVLAVVLGAVLIHLAL